MSSVFSLSIVVLEDLVWINSAALEYGYNFLRQLLERLQAYSSNPPLTIKIVMEEVSQSIRENVRRRVIEAYVY